MGSAPPHKRAFTSRHDVAIWCECVRTFGCPPPIDKLATCKLKLLAHARLRQRKVNNIDSRAVLFAAFAERLLVRIIGSEMRLEWLCGRLLYTRPSDVITIWHKASKPRHPHITCVTSRESRCVKCYYLEHNTVGASHSRLIHKS